VGTGHTLQSTDAAAAGTATAAPWLLSSDSHIVEPPDLWTARMPYDETLPRVVREDDGDWWYIDGHKTMSFLGIQPGMRFEKNPDLLRTSGTFEEVVPAAYDPHAYVKANEADGVWGSVIYPSEGLVLFGVPTTDVVTKAMRVYNDWIGEFCAAEPSRLRHAEPRRSPAGRGGVAPLPRPRPGGGADHRGTPAVGALSQSRLRRLLGRRG